MCYKYIVSLIVETNYKKIIFAIYRTGWVSVRVAKWISRPTSNREIAGSSPASDLSTFSKKWSKNLMLT